MGGEPFGGHSLEKEIKWQVVSSEGDDLCVVCVSVFGLVSLQWDGDTVPQKFPLLQG